MPNRVADRAAAEEFWTTQKKSSIPDCCFKLFTSLFFWASACDLKFITKQLKTKIYILTLKIIQNIIIIKHKTNTL